MENKSPQDFTAKAAFYNGRLSKEMKLVSKAGLARDFYTRLKENKIGTSKIERQAWDLILERASEEEKKLWIERGKKEKGDFKFTRRDPKAVMDVLDLKIKYAKEDESLYRRQYRETKRQMKKIYEGKNRQRKFDRVIQRITRQNKTRWEKASIPTELE